jgi:hypothetical protein
MATEQKEKKKKISYWHYYKRAKAFDKPNEDMDPNFVPLHQQFSRSAADLSYLMSELNAEESRVKNMQGGVFPKWTQEQQRRWRTSATFEGSDFNVWNLLQYYPKGDRRAMKREFLKRIVWIKAKLMRGATGDNVTGIKGDLRFFTEEMKKLKQYERRMFVWRLNVNNWWSSDELYEMRPVEIVIMWFKIFHVLCFLPFVLWMWFLYSNFECGILNQWPYDDTNYVGGLRLLYMPDAEEIHGDILKGDYWMYYPTQYFDGFFSAWELYYVSYTRDKDWDLWIATMPNRTEKFQSKVIKLLLERPTCRNYTEKFCSYESGQYVVTFQPFASYMQSGHAPSCSYAWGFPDMNGGSEAKSDVWDATEAIEKSVATAKASGIKVIVNGPGEIETLLDQTAVSARGRAARGEMLCYQHHKTVDVLPDHSWWVLNYIQDLWFFRDPITTVRMIWDNNFRDYSFEGKMYEVLDKRTGDVAMQYIREYKLEEYYNFRKEGAVSARLMREHGFLDDAQRIEDTRKFLQFYNEYGHEHPEANMQQHYLPVVRTQHDFLEECCERLAAKLEADKLASLGPTECHDRVRYSFSRWILNKLLNEPEKVLFFSEKQEVWSDANIIRPSDKAIAFNTPAGPKDDIGVGLVRQKVPPIDPQYEAANVNSSPKFRNLIGSTEI